MPKTDDATTLEDYAPVADRITLFYQRHPHGRIITELVSRGDTEIVFKALVFRSPDERDPAATGWASERIGDGEINTVACLENTETSAVGRALANLGLTAARLRPSREEMNKAARMRVVREVAPSSAPNGTTATGAASLESLANRLHDVLDLLSEAERAGLPARKVAMSRARLASPAVDLTMIERIEQGLTAWLAEKAARDAAGWPPSDR
jgi:hypothetical protein